MGGAPRRHRSGPAARAHSRVRPWPSHFLGAAGAGARAMALAAASDKLASPRRAARPGHPGDRTWRSPAARPQDPGHSACCRRAARPGAPGTRLENSGAIEVSGFRPNAVQPINQSSTTARHRARVAMVHAILGVSAPAAKTKARIPTVARTIRPRVRHGKVNIRLTLRCAALPAPRPSVRWSGAAARSDNARNRADRRRTVGGPLAATRVLAGPVSAAPGWSSARRGRSAEVPFIRFDSGEPS
jgi:hypothetical protein